MPSPIRAAAAYTGRFAPSPSGPLHAGSLVAAMASYLDARAHAGRWLLRIEDIDAPRVVAGADRLIMRQLSALGMHWDAEPAWQSRRHALYRRAFDLLRAKGLVYGCACTRREIDIALARTAASRQARGLGATDAGRTERPYPGTCRNGLRPGQRPRAWRFRVPRGVERFHDRWQGPQAQDVEHETGDFVLRRADGLWAYQLVVVVDDAEQGITDIVRGADLLSSTGRQRMLARALGLPCPRVLHVPLVRDLEGRKLSKQNHAPAIDIRRPVAELDLAWTRLGFEPTAAPDVPAFWSAARRKWAARFPLGEAAGP